jgi:hypothetical protein
VTSLNGPAWSGQITPRNNYSGARGDGEGAASYDPGSAAANAIAGLGTALDKSVKAIHGHYAGTAMHRVAA